MTVVLVETNHDLSAILKRARSRFALRLKLLALRHTLAMSLGMTIHVAGAFPRLMRAHQRSSPRASKIRIVPEMVSRTTGHTCKAPKRGDVTQPSPQLLLYIPLGKSHYFCHFWYDFFWGERSHKSASQGPFLNACPNRSSADSGNGIRSRRPSVSSTGGLLLLHNLCPLQDSTDSTLALPRV